MSKAKKLTVINYSLSAILLVLAVLLFLFNKLEHYYSWIILGYIFIILVPFNVIFIILANVHSSKENNKKLQDMNFATIIFNLVVFLFIVLIASKWGI